MYGGAFSFAHCSLLGANDAHKWISFVLNFAFVIVYVYQAAALEREHSRERIPKRVDMLWAGTATLGGVDSDGDLAGFVGTHPDDAGAAPDAAGRRRARG